MIELTRDLKQYRDVERFEEYELTNCIAYEMAIRNKEVIILLNDFLDQYLNNDIYTDTIIFETTQMNLISDKLLDLGINPFQLYLDYHYFSKMKKAIDEYINDILKDYGDCSTEYFNVMGIWYNRKQSEHLRTPMDDKSMADLLGKEHPTVDKWTHNTTTKYYSSLTIYTEENNQKKGKIKSLIRHEIEPIYSRPMLHISKDISQEVDIKINLSLPIHELHDFLIKLKNDHLKQSLNCKTPFELIGKELTKSGHKRKNGISALDWGDALFIYDYRNLHKKEKSKGDIISDIKIELSHYHRKRGSTWRKGKNPIKDDYVNEKTTYTYLNMMIDYIDNLRYKELLTGISLQDL